VWYQISVHISKAIPVQRQPLLSCCMEKIYGALGIFKSPKKFPYSRILELNRVEEHHDFEISLLPLHHIPPFYLKA
jgi:hypothetical protein